MVAPEPNPSRHHHSCRCNQCVRRRNARRHLDEARHRSTDRPLPICRPSVLSRLSRLWPANCCGCRCIRASRTPELDSLPAWSWRSSSGISDSHSGWNMLAGPDFPLFIMMGVPLRVVHRCSLKGIHRQASAPWCFRILASMPTSLFGSGLTGAPVAPSKMRSDGQPMTKDGR